MSTEVAGLLWERSRALYRLASWALKGEVERACELLHQAVPRAAAIGVDSCRSCESANASSGNGTLTRTSGSWTTRYGRPQAGFGSADRRAAPERPRRVFGRRPGKVMCADGYEDSRDVWPDARGDGLPGHVNVDHPCPAPRRAGPCPVRRRPTS
jgi:hypothetical protein